MYLENYNEPSIPRQGWLWEGVIRLWYCRGAAKLHFFDTRSAGKPIQVFPCKAVAASDKIRTEAGSCTSLLSSFRT